MAPRARVLDAEPVPESDRIGELSHPRETTALFGHAEAAATLAQAARSGRLHHAWLIGGPKGVGKATLAWRFARALLAHGASSVPDDLSVPENHPVARHIAALAHPDVISIRRPWDADRKRHRTELPVAEIRRLHGFFSRHSSEGGYRVVVIDTADDMNREAENALLKMLEEPPPNSLLLLVANAPGALLPTTRSRCRALTLRPLPAAEMDEALRALAPDADDRTRILVSALAEGCPGRALELIETDAPAVYAEITDIVRTLPKLNGTRLFAFADKIARGAGADRGLTLFVALLSGILQRTVRGAFGGVGDVPGEAALLDHLRKLGSLDAWAALWENQRAAALRADALNLDKKQVVLNAFFEMEALAANRG